MTAPPIKNTFPDVGWVHKWKEDSNQLHSNKISRFDMHMFLAAVPFARLELFSDLYTPVLSYRQVTGTKRVI